MSLMSSCSSLFWVCAIFWPSVGDVIVFGVAAALMVAQVPSRKLVRAINMRVWVLGMALLRVLFFCNRVLFFENNVVVF